MKLMTKELEKRFTEIGDQSDVENPIIIAKFFNPVGSQTWYATGYNAEYKICQGYVTGMSFDEWGQFSITELESVRLPYGCRIERDLYFKEKTFGEQFPQKPQKRESEIEALNSNKDKKQELER